MSARTRFGSVYIRMTFFCTSSAVSDRWIVLPRLLLIFLSPSRPGSRLNVVSSGWGSTSTSPKKLLKRRTAFARQLEVRDLIFADRNALRVVHGDVGGLQQRVAEKPDRRQILVLEVVLLLLVGRHALEPGHRHDHRQQQVQLGVLGHERLDEKRALLGIEAGADPVGDVLVGVRRQLARVGVVARQRVPVGDEIEAVVLLLQRHPVAERADQMAEMQAARRPHAGDDAVFLH